LSFALTIGMAIVCLKNSGHNPRPERELAINYPSPAGFAGGLGDCGGFRMIVIVLHVSQGCIPDGQCGENAPRVSSRIARGDRPTGKEGKG
jgi:hypothetical protein